MTRTIRKCRRLLKSNSEGESGLQHENARLVSPKITASFFFHKILVQPDIPSRYCCSYFKKEPRKILDQNLRGMFLSSIKVFEHIQGHNASICRYLCSCTNETTYMSKQLYNNLMDVSLGGNNISLHAGIYG